jgi:cell wall-associated NlpC family hydrolase
VTRLYVDDRGALSDLVVRGADASYLQLAERIQTASLSFSSSQISQLDLLLREDPERYDLLNSGLFRPAQGNSPNDGQCDLGSLRMQLATIATSDRGRDADLTVQARSWGGQRMATNTDPSTMVNIDPAEWVRRKAESLGMKTVVKASGQTWAQVGNESGKDSWETSQKIAKDLGYWLFEAAGTLYFGPPTWLVNQTPRRSYTWRLNPIGDQGYADPLLRAPKFRTSGDASAGTSPVTVSLELADSENDLLPGTGLDLAGIPTYAGTYIVTDVKVPLAAGARIAVTAEQPVDPTPGDTSKYQRSEALENIGTAVTGDRAGTVRTPAPGSFGGTSLNAEQIGFAVTIVQVAIDRKLTMPRAGTLAIMCALQESKLRNLKGGDKDSVGLFQQRPSQGWGTIAQCRTPTYAAGKFYSELVRLVPGYAALTSTTQFGDAIQKVQKSGFPRAYDQWQNTAAALVAAIRVTGTTGSNTVSASAASSGNQVEAFVQKCLAQAGDTYRFGAEVRLADPNPDTFDCSELVEWACFQVGVKIPDGSQNQRRVCTGFRKLSIAQAMKTRGALVFTGGHVAVSLGNGQTIEAKGRKYGVVIDVVGTRFVDAGLIPGMAGYVVGG